MPDLKTILKHYPEITGIHPACLAVPEIDGEDFAKLETSIARDGLRHEILLTEDGLLLDGRNRLLACFNGKIDPRFQKVSLDPWKVAYSENIARRHLTTKQKTFFGVAWKEYEEAEAKKRQSLAGGDRSKALVETFPPADTGKSRDKAGERVGVSGKSIDKGMVISEYAPEKWHDESTLEEAFKEANTRKRASTTKPVDIPVVQTQEMTTIVTADGRQSQIALPKKVVFNQTNNSVDWASWTWNPVTGCEHGCKFCYAREIANSERMKPFYPNGFSPTYHEYRLAAPANTPKPVSEDARDGRVFVCSMADLFGKWVPTQWIRSVFEACHESPHWEYLFLTKWPARYSQMPLLSHAWYGASVIGQRDVERVQNAMLKFDAPGCVKWISLEPMLEPIEFSNIDWCDLVVIGSQTSTNQPDGFVPAFAPHFDWVVDVVNQCREAGVPYYLKANLGMEQPGMKLPKSLPRVKHELQNIC